ncbi:glycosyltransferase family 9 protein [Methylobacillus sp. Pita2]|uniref:glycosyltransferase family 9 protein n=1 Tax=Methylobacillus sp. Pita2 TaxID=3383245 RepID=UPI0038B53AAD
MIITTIKVLIVFLIIRAYRFFVTVFFIPNVGVQKKALIVRLDNIGDFVLWKNSAEVLLSDLHKKGYCVSLIANSSWASYADKILPFDEVIAYDFGSIIKTKFFGFALVKKLVLDDFDLVINPVFSRNIYISDPVVLATNAREKIGCLGDCSNLSKIENFFSKFIYTKLINVGDNFLHELQNNENFLRNIGVLGDLAVRPQLPKIAMKNVTFPENFFILAIGSSWAGKSWPLIRFKALSKWLISEYKFTPVIIGGEYDRENGDFIVDGDGLNLCGKTSLEVLANIFSKSRFVISNDSAAIHFAYSAGTPAICILGGGHFGRFLPYPKIKDGFPVPRAVHANMNCFGCNWKCCYKRRPDEPVKCIDNVTLDMVKKEVVLLL